MSEKLDQSYKYCPEHTNVAISCSKIDDIDQNVKDIKKSINELNKNMSTFQTKIGVNEERWKNAKWAIGVVVTVQAGIVGAMILKSLGI